MATRDVFSADELAQLRGFPEVGRAELIRFFMLTPADEEFVRRFRDKRNVLGAAVQLCTLPWLGFVPEDVPAAPAAAVAWLSERLGIPVGELRGYGAREQTRSDHLRDVAAYLGWHQVDRPRWKDLEEFLFARALEHDSPKLLFRLACEYLSSSRLVRPGVVLILERVATARKRARKETWQRVEPMLTGFLRGELDGMLVPDPLLGRTRLAWLGTGPTSPTPAAVNGELEKLAYLRGMDAHTLDLSVLPAERRRFLAGLGRRLTAQSLARRDDDRRYPILLTLAAQSAVDVLDEVLLLFDQALSRREAAAREKLTEVLAERAKGGEDRQALLDDILTIVLDPDVPDDQVGVTEHATDTHGATLANFALFDLTGLQLSPRIRDLGKITLYRTGPRTDFAARYPASGHLLTRRLNEDLITGMWDDVLRVAASVKGGHASGALVVGKLCSSRRQQNALAAAIKEYGALRRTVYAARYLVDETYRRRIGRQLNKGENVHSLKRMLAYAGEGAIRRRHHEEQAEQMWCLTLATNAVVTWTTEYNGLAVTALRRSGRDIDDAVLAHIWPTHHENIHFYGTHSVDIVGELAKLGSDGYRPVRSTQYG